MGAAYGGCYFIPSNAKQSLMTGVRKKSELGQSEACRAIGL